MSVSIAQVGLSLFAKIADATIQGSGKERSLVSATKGARFEPIVLVDSDVTTYEGTYDIMVSLQSIFTGYLLQAISIYGNVGNTKVVKELDRFNPSREPKYLEFAKSVVSAENYKYRLATPNGSISLEALDTNPRRVSNAFKVAVENDRISVSRADDMEKNLTQSVNLSVGKIWNVDFSSNGQKVTVPITVRLISTVVPSDRLTHILTQDANKLTDLKERYYAWRAGRLNFISDLLLMKDLRNQHLKELMHDKDGIYSNILKRRVSNNLSTLTSGAPSLASASNMLVISSDTAKQIEQKLNGKLSNYNTRAGFFSGANIRDKVTQGSSLMIIAVVDKFADRVTFYTDGISESTNLSLREIRASNKSGGPDVTEILKAYQLGSSPSSL